MQFILEDDELWIRITIIVLQIGQLRNGVTCGAT